MGYHGQIGIVAVGYFGSEFNLYLVLRFLFVVHF